MNPASAPEQRPVSHRAGAAVSMVAIGFVILAIGHAGLYLFLTGDARDGLARLETQHKVADLEGAKKPGPTPLAGSAEYSPWLRRYERWDAASEYTLHARHEGLVRTGMILSFLVGLGLLANGMFRTAKTPQRRSSDRRRSVAPRPAQPVRAAPARATPAQKPVRQPARRPARQPARQPARAAALKPVAVRPVRLRKSA